MKDNPRSTRQADSLISFDRYYRYDDIVQYMFNVSQLQDWVNVVEIGRTMYALEITKAGDGAVANIYSQVIFQLFFTANPVCRPEFLGWNTCKRMDSPCSCHVYYLRVS